MDTLTKNKHWKLKTKPVCRIMLHCHTNTRFTTGGIKGNKGDEAASICRSQMSATIPPILIPTSDENHNNANIMDALMVTMQRLHEFA